MASARLLWRGSITVSPKDYAGEPTSSLYNGHNDDNDDDEDDVQLHGLAIVAPSFNVADLEQDDFFSSGSKAATSTNGHSASKVERINADLCLDLEMLRHRTLSVRSRRVKLAGTGNDGVDKDKEEGKVHGRRALKKSIEMLRKGKSRQIDSQDEEEVVHLDIPSTSNQALKLYIDPRCQDTMEWFNEVFCSQPVDPVTLRTLAGIAVSLGVENALLAPSNDSRDTIIVYGQVDMRAPTHSRAPLLQLYVARQKDMTDLGPRPDDPAPRENLFAQKLRRSVSQPSMAFSHLGKGKDAALRNKPPNGTSLHPTDKPRTGLQRSQSSLAGTSKARNPFAGGAPANGADGNIKKRALSSGVLGAAKGAVAQNVHASPGRRGSKRPRLTAGGLKQLQEIEGEDEDMEDDIEDQLSVMRREGSPTPSAATNLSLNFKITNLQGTTKAGLRRSESMPPGQLGLRVGRAQTREPSVAPSIAATEDDTKEGGSLETRNKGTIRKTLLAEMVTRRVGREHPEFKDIFSVAYRGICCAFRHVLAVQKVDKIEIIICTRKHLEMYITADSSAGLLPRVSNGGLAEEIT